MSTIRVLHVIARMNVGGTARYVGDLVQSIPGSALATGCVQGDEIEDAITTKLPIYRINHLGRRISPINDFKSWLELRSLIKELKPEIIHTHTFKAGLIGRLVAGDHKRIHTFHGHLFKDQSFSAIEKIIITVTERLLSRRTDLLISVGTRVGNELRAEGVGKNRIWTSIPPGVTPLPLVEKSVARERLELESEKILIGWMARMTNVKNPHLMLEVAKAMPEVSFVMAGGGDLLDDIIKKAPDNVNVIGWCDASTFWSAVDCAISTSDNEGMPIALIEAQLAGLPTIATDVGSNAEVVIDGVTGFITRKNCNSLVSAVNALISNPTSMARMSPRATELSLTKFNLESMVSAHNQLYRSVLIDPSLKSKKHT